MLMHGLHYSVLLVVYRSLKFPVATTGEVSVVKTALTSTVSLHVFVAYRLAQAFDLHELRIGVFILILILQIILTC